VLLSLLLLLLLMMLMMMMRVFSLCLSTLSSVVEAVLLGLMDRFVVLPPAGRKCA